MKKTRLALVTLGGQSVHVKAKALQDTLDLLAADLPSFAISDGLLVVHTDRITSRLYAVEPGCQDTIATVRVPIPHPPARRSTGATQGQQMPLWGSA